MDPLLRQLCEVVDTEYNGIILYCTRNELGRSKHYLLVDNPEYIHFFDRTDDNTGEMIDRTDDVHNPYLKKEILEIDTRRDLGLTRIIDMDHTVYVFYARAGRVTDCRDSPVPMTDYQGTVKEMIEAHMQAQRNRL